MRIIPGWRNCSDTVRATSSIHGELKVQQLEPLASALQA
jgi:hypothetical protein